MYSTVCTTSPLSFSLILILDYGNVCGVFYLRYFRFALSCIFLYWGVLVTTSHKISIEVTIHKLLRCTHCNICNVFWFKYDNRSLIICTIIKSYYFCNEDVFQFKRCICKHCYGYRIRVHLHSWTSIVLWWKCIPVRHNIDMKIQVSILLVLVLLLAFIILPSKKSTVSLRFWFPLRIRLKDSSVHVKFYDHGLLDNNMKETTVLVIIHLEYFYYDTIAISCCWIKSDILDVMCFVMVHDYYHSASFFHKLISSLGCG